MKQDLLEIEKKVETVDDFINVLLDTKQNLYKEFLDTFNIETDDRYVEIEKEYIDDEHLETKYGDKKRKSKEDEQLSTEFTGNIQTFKDVEQIAPIINTNYVSTVHISQRKSKIEYIVFHYTAGASSRAGSAINTCKVFHSRPASADFIVDDADIIQYNPDPSKYYCWSVGDSGQKRTFGASLRGVCRNKNSISIEMCSNLKKGYSPLYPNHDGWYFTQATINNAIKLGRILMQKYNIDIEHVCRHYDVTGKMCPGIPGWNLEKGSQSNAAWNWFKSQL